jgi:nucleotide-binding universal stress UspA family protein
MTWAEPQARTAPTMFRSPLPTLAEREPPALFQKIVVMLGIADDERALITAAHTLAERFQSKICFLRGRVKGDASAGDVVSIADVTDLSCCSWPAWEAAVRAQSPSLVLMMEHSVPSESAWFGTTAQRFVRHVRCPILVMRPQQSWQISSVLYLMDFSEAGLCALQTAAHVARAESAKLTVLHVVLETGTDLRAETTVWNALKAQVSKPAGLAALRNVVAVQNNQALIAAARCEVDELLRQVDISGIQTRVVVTSGAAVSAALREAREQKASLVVTAQGAHLASTLLQVQSPAEELVATCPVSVLVLS